MNERFKMPELSDDRLEQMIHLAVSLPQETVPQHEPWYQRLFSPQPRLAYGLSAIAVTASCLVAFWLAPSITTVPPKPVAKQLPISDYLIEDLLDELV